MIPDYEVQLCTDETKNTDISLLAFIIINKVKWRAKFYDQIYFCLFLLDGEQANIGTKDFPDVNAITGALKLYLRQLPIPLVPFEVYDKFTAAASKYRSLYWL